MEEAELAQTRTITPSIWETTEATKHRDRLTEDLQVDVAIIGSGIVGLSAAYMLKESGLRVAVLERDRILEGVTGKTTAKVTAQHGIIYSLLAKRLGRKAARDHAKAAQAAQDQIARFIKETGTDAHYTQAPSYVYTTEDRHADLLKREAAAAAEAGLPAHFVTHTELPFPIKGAVRLDHQAHFHPRKYLSSLAEQAEAGDTTIYEQTPVLSYQGADPCTLTTPEASVKADNVVIATNIPVNDRTFFVHRMRPKREYVIAAQENGVTLSGMYVNHETPRRSVRPYEGDDGPMLVITGESHETGSSGARDPFAELESFGREHFGIERVTHRWSTQDYYPLDDMPLIGPISPTQDHLYTATGFRAWGMTQGTTAASLIAAGIQGETKPWAYLYDPHAPRRFVHDMASPALWKTGAHVTKQFIGKRLARDEGTPLRPGEGRLQQTRGRKVAVSMDRDGELRRCEAKCTHMGCIVSWNDIEQSWDCPCHGARFAPDGSVLHGPAVQPLAAAEDDTDTDKTQH